MAVFVEERGRNWTPDEIGPRDEIGPLGERRFISVGRFVGQETSGALVVLLVEGRPPVAVVLAQVVGDDGGELHVRLDGYGGGGARDQLHFVPIRVEVEQVDPAADPLA